MIKEKIAGGNLVVIRPCHTKGKIMGEARIGGKNGNVNLKNLENAVIGLPDVKNILYSEDLGLLKYTQGEKNVFVFENGFVRVKNAKGRGDVLETIDFLKRAEIRSWSGGCDLNTRK